MPIPNADQNLLFGFIALQNGLLSREDLIAATSVWLQDKSQPLDQVLLDRGLLTEENHQLVLSLAQHHLAKHDGDAEKSIAAIDAVSSVREELQRLGDEDVEASLIQATQIRKDESQFTRTIAWSLSSPDARYQVLRPHAKGGLGLVSVALDEELKREVAFKEIQEQYADDENGRARFVREAEITGGLEHPGIVPVYGLGQYEDGRPYYAMRLVKGKNLRDAINDFHEAGEAQSQSSERSLPFRQLLGQFIDVCNAIEYAHSRGILHRDIKPANVMLGKYGETLVVDWGLAKPIGRSEEHRSRDEETLQPMSGAESSRTRMGSAIGTPSFMSPEQAAGRLGDLGPTSDVYSLVAMLYCILTGQPPLHDSDAGTAIRKAEQGDFPPPRSIQPGIPAALEAVCLKAMAFNPKERYASASLLSADIERWLADEPVDAHQDSFSEQVSRFSRRNRSWVQAGAVATLLITVCSVAAAVFTNAARQEALILARSEAAAHERAQRLAEDEAAARKETQRLLYVSDMDVALQEWTEGNVERVVTLLKRHQPQEREEDLRGFEWYHVWQLCNGPLQTPTLNHDDDVNSIAYSPDGRILASASKKVVTLWDVKTLEKKVFDSDDNFVWGVAFSPDGKRVASANSGGTVKIWNVKTEQQEHELEHGSGVWCVAFSPDGDTMASGGGRGRLILWNVETGEELATLQHERQVVTVAFSSDGRLLASGSWAGTVRLWDVVSNQELHRFTAKDRIWSVDFSPDSRRVAVRSTSEMTLWDVENGDRQQLTEGNPMGLGARAVAFSQDGKKLASSGPANTVKLWDAATGEELATIRGHSAEVCCVAFSPDGDTVASGSLDGSVKLWELTVVDDRSTIRPHGGKVDSISFSPDGVLLASAASSDRTLKLWETRTWSVLNTITESGKGRIWMAFSPRGETLAYSHVSGGPEGTQVKLLDVKSREVRQSLTGYLKHNIWSLAFSRDGRYLASAGERGAVKFWDLEGEREATAPVEHDGPVRKVVISPDGKMLASGGADSTVKLWDLATRTVQHDITGHTREVWALAFTPDGKMLASGSYDRTLRLWNVQTGVEEAIFTRNAGAVNCLAFSPDGTTMASAADRTVTLWHVESRQQRARFRGHAPVYSVTYSPDSRTLVAGLADGTMKIWRAADPEEVRRAGWWASLTNDLP